LRRACREGFGLAVFFSVKNSRFLTLARPPPALMRAGGSPQGSLMTAIDPSKHTFACTTPPVARALLRVRNPAPPRAAPCPAHLPAGYTELAVEACMSVAIRMVHDLKNSDVERDPGEMLTLHSLFALLSDVSGLVGPQERDTDIEKSHREEVVPPAKARRADSSRGLSVDEVCERLAGKRTR
jgi:hypothetical protein